MTCQILQSLSVALLAGLDALTGFAFARLRSRAWVLGFVLPLIVILMIGLTRRSYPLQFVAPFRWLDAGRTEFAAVAFLAAMLMMTPIARLPRSRLRWLSAIFVASFVVQASVMPFLMPALQRDELSKLHTKFTADGVCLQSTDYTCGPAAAVTALRAMGITAAEGDLAVLAHTSRSTGTEPDVLADVLQARYAAQGLWFTYQPFKSAADLPTDRPTIALINYTFFVDHYVAVLKIGKDDVTIGDPLTGLTHQSFAAFEHDWRKVGIVVSKSAR